MATSASKKSPAARLFTLIRSARSAASSGPVASSEKSPNSTALSRTFASRYALPICRRRLGCGCANVIGIAPVWNVMCRLVRRLRETCERGLLVRDDLLQFGGRGDPHPHANRVEASGQILIASNCAQIGADPLAQFQ